MNWNPQPEMEDREPCPEVEVCHFDYYVPVVRKLMHSYFYDPATEEGRRLQEETQKAEYALHCAMVDFLKTNNVDAATGARALWRTVVSCAKEFERKWFAGDLTPRGGTK